MNRLPVGWLPRSEADLATAAAQGLLEESHSLDIKRELAAGTSANREAAKDMASFAVDGGLLVYGVDESSTPPALTPQPLAGLAERLEQIALLAIAEPLAVTTTVISSTASPTDGFVVVNVPASGSAPHMVDGRYYGRGDKTKIVLTDAQVVALHARRLEGRTDLIAAARMYLDEAPVAASEGLVVALARPVAATAPLLRALALSDRWQEEALQLLGSVANGSPGYAPSIRGATTVSRRPRGIGLTSGLDPYRRVEAGGDPERARQRIVEVVLDEGGQATILSARGTDGHKGYKLIFDKLIAGVARNIVDLASEIGARSGYAGNWEFALVASGLRDGTSWALDDHHSSGHPYTQDEYAAATAATPPEIDGLPETVAARLVGDLLRALGSESMREFQQFRPA